MTMIMIVECCVCHKEVRRSTIKKMPGVIDPIVSHGYCPTCFKKVIHQMQEDLKEFTHKGDK